MFTLAVLGYLAFSLYGFYRGYQLGVKRTKEEWANANAGIRNYE